MIIVDTDMWIFITRFVIGKTVYYRGKRLCNTPGSTKSVLALRNYHRFCLFDGCLFFSIVSRRPFSSPEIDALVGYVSYQCFFLRVFIVLNIFFLISRARVFFCVCVYACVHHQNTCSSFLHSPMTSLLHNSISVRP